MLYEVTLRQSYFGQQCINRFHYNSAGTPAAVSGSFALVSAMGFIPDAELGTYDETKLFHKLRLIQSTSLTYTEVEARALYDVVDFYTRPWSPPAPGLSGGEAGAPFLATGFRSNRVRTDIRRSFKRFAGISESAVAAGGAIDGGVLATLATQAAALSAVLTYDDEGNTLTFSPCVLSFDKVVSEGEPDKYVPYPTLAEQLEHVAQGIVYAPQPQVRSQVSRQYNRGT